MVALLLFLVSNAFIATYPGIDPDYGFQFERRIKRYFVLFRLELRVSTSRRQIHKSNHLLTHCCVSLITLE